MYDKNRFATPLCGDDMEIFSFVHGLRIAAKDAKIHLICGYRLIARLYKFRDMNKSTVLDNTLIKGLPKDVISELVSRMDNKNEYTKALTQLAK